MENMEQEIRAVFAKMEDPNRQQETDTPLPPDEIQDIYVLIVREQEEEAKHVQIVESEPSKDQHIPPQPYDKVTFCIVFVCCLPILSSLMLLVYLLVNPPIATITIIPTSHHVTINGTMQLGRVLSPLTISQSLTTPTTGKGHQDARAATGFVTLYNGQLSSVFVPAGTILTSFTGVQVITDQDATLPGASPPIEGQATVPAHAATPGIQGNIPTKAINEACCAVSVLAANLTPFTGGQNERDFSTVSTQDIHKISTPLTTSVTQSMHGALQSQLQPNEELSLLPCIPHITANHQTGEEATQVTVTVSETCSAVAYNHQELTQKSLHFLSTTTSVRLEAGYSAIAAIHTTITSLTVQKHVVVVSVTVQALLVYQFTPAQAHAFMSLIAGKTKQEAMHTLLSLKGIQSASIAWSNDTKLPKDPTYIHVHIIENV